MSVSRILLSVLLAGSMALRLAEADEAKSSLGAAKAALETAAQSLTDIRIAEVVEMDIRMDENKAVEFRTKVRVSFKYHPEKVH